MTYFKAKWICDYYKLTNEERHNLLKSYLLDSVLTIDYDPIEELFIVYHFNGQIDYRYRKDLTEND